MNGSLLKEPEPHGHVRHWTVGGDDGVLVQDIGNDVSGHRQLS